VAGKFVARGRAVFPAAWEGGKKNHFRLGQGIPVTPAWRRFRERFISFPRRGGPGREKLTGEKSPGRRWGPGPRKGRKRFPSDTGLDWGEFGPAGADAGGLPDGNCMHTSPLRRSGGWGGWGGGWWGTLLFREFTIDAQPKLLSGMPWGRPGGFRRAVLETWPFWSRPRGQTLWRRCLSGIRFSTYFLRLGPPSPLLMSRPEKSADKAL